MRHATESALDHTEYGIDIRSRHRALSADVLQFLITDCEDPAVLADRELPSSVSSPEDTRVAGRWEAVAMTSRERSTVTMTLVMSGRDVGGNVHYGPPAFDLTLPLVGRMVTSSRLTATIGTGDSAVTFAGTLDADGLTIEGPVVYAGRVLYTLRLARR